MVDSSELAVHVEGLGKCYRIYQDPGHRVIEALTGGRWVRHTPRWALRGMSFDLPRGQSIGIVGANGAGKSTLLKVLSGITPATEGSFQINGKLASLLELGGGFHPAFNGRQNAFMHAAIHGIPNREMRARLPEIQEFAELGQEFYHPIRTYSSGMTMRLAFALATLVRPDVLILDEVLAVGDQRFQRKCVDRIYEARELGTSILFVSHSLYHVRQICDLAVWVQDGSPRLLGDPIEVTDAYANWVQEQNRAADQQKEIVGPTPGAPSLESLAMTRPDGRPLQILRPGETLMMDIRWSGNLAHHSLEMVIFRNDDIPVETMTSRSAAPETDFSQQRILLHVPIRLTTGTYRISGRVVDGQNQPVHVLPDFGQFQVANEGMETGVFVPEVRWMSPEDALR